MAKPAPTDPTAPKSVALGEYRRGMLAKEIEDKAFALNAGQHTQPIRTKQGFIILQATQHQLGGDASFKQVEPQVEEALFMERMQPALRVYLTKLREEAFVDLKPGVVDTGASGNEMRLTYSAYTPPAEKKKKKFARARFRGRDRSTRPGRDANGGCSDPSRRRQPTPVRRSDPRCRHGSHWRPPPQRCQQAGHATGKQQRPERAEARQEREDPLRAGPARVSSCFLAGRHGQRPLGSGHESECHHSGDALRKPRWYDYQHRACRRMKARLA